MKLTPMSDDKPESTFDMPFQADSDACVMVRLARETTFLSCGAANVYIYLIE